MPAVLRAENLGGRWANVFSDIQLRIPWIVVFDVPDD
jgi:hypothetical protein